MSRKNARNTRDSDPNGRTVRGRPFEPGNPGRPPGSRNKATLAMEALLYGEGEEIMKAAIALAKTGNEKCIRMCLDRLVAPRKERTVRFNLPPLRSVEDVAPAGAAVAQAFAQGELSAGEAERVFRMLDTYKRLATDSELETRSNASDEQRLPRDVL